MTTKPQREILNQALYTLFRYIKIKWEKLENAYFLANGVQRMEKTAKGVFTIKIRTLNGGFVKISCKPYLSEKDIRDFLHTSNPVIVNNIPEKELESLIHELTTFEQNLDK